MFQQLLNALSPKRVLRNRTILQTPVKQEDEKDSTISSTYQTQNHNPSVTANTNTVATTTYQTHTPLETEFKDLPDLSSRSIDIWISKWKEYHGKHGIKSAISCISPGDKLQMREKETIGDDTETISEEEFDAMFSTNNEFIEYLESWNIVTTLTATKFFATKKMKMAYSEHFNDFTSEKVNLHISYFLAAVENKKTMLQNLNCGEKAKAQALINSLEPAILRTRVADLKGKTVRAVLKHITASMAYLEIYHEVHTELNPKVNTHNKHAKQHIQPTKAPEVIAIASTTDGYRANNVKFDNISCRNCRNKGHYASWCTEICGRCTPPCGLLAEECTKAIAIAKAEKAEYDSKRQTKVNNNKQINIISSSNNNTKPTHPLFLYDSGANMNCINDNTLMNNTSNPVPSTITTADNTSISVKQGGFFDHPCLYTPSFNNNLVTHDFLTNNNNNIILIYNNTLHITPINEYNKEYIEKISSDSSGTKINTNNDNLFFLTYNDLEQIFNTNRAV